MGGDARLRTNHTFYSLENGLHHHRNELFKQSVEIRLSVGGSAVYEDRGNLDDELILSPTALVGISEFEFHGFQCALEAGLAEDSDESRSGGWEF